VLAAAVGALAEQGEHEREGGAAGFGIAVPVAVAALEEGEDVQGVAGAGARREDADVRAAAEAAQVVEAEVPGLELPQALAGELLGEVCGGRGVGGPCRLQPGGEGAASTLGMTIRRPVLPLPVIPSMTRWCGGTSGARNRG
jgi:hypothetical protein